MPLHVDLLETSFDLIAPHADEVVEIYYGRFLAAAPSAAPLFANTEWPRQKAKVIGTLVLLRKSLRDLDAIVPKLRALGARHYAYGARPEHYPISGEILIGAMAEVAGDAWRSEYTRAWCAAFKLVFAAMLQGAAEAEFRAAA